MITVVSGLPRSGTSLMMQMLAAGGMPLLTDEVRAPDNNNPRGYFEFDPVKRLNRDSSWMREARGKGVKIVSPLLRYLPEDENYRILFMRRDIAEVLQSQAAMLAREGKEDDVAHPSLRDALERHLVNVEELMETRKIPVLYVEHRALITAPAEESRRIAEFLGLTLNTAAMDAASDPALYRERRK